MSGIYSFLSSSDKLELLPDDTKVNIWGDRSYQGIYCKTDEDPLYNDIELNCNAFSQQMANNITMNPSWHCHSRLNYSNLFVFENQHFTLIFGLLITLTFIFAFFTVIYDWRLIKHRQDLTKMVEWFPNHDDDMLFEYLCCWKCCLSNKNNNKNKPNKSKFDNDYHKKNAKCCIVRVFMSQFC